MTIEQAGAYYLDWICWSNRSSEWMDRLTREKSYAQMLSDAYQDKARRAAKILGVSAQALDAPPQPWPDAVVKPVNGVVNDLLGEVSALNALGDARNTTSAASAWNDYTKGSNTNAQKVRLRLGLPAANAKYDGCKGRGARPREAATPTARS